MCAHLSRRLKTCMYENGCNSWSRSKCLVFDAALLATAAVIAQCSPNLTYLDFVVEFVSFVDIYNCAAPYRENYYTGPNLIFCLKKRNSLSVLIESNLYRLDVGCRLYDDYIIFDKNVKL